MQLIVELRLVESIRINQMASLQRTRVNGTTYWRIVESRRIKGKPRAIPILQLGTADALLTRLTGAAPGGSLRVRSFQHGGVAALTAIARRLQIAELIDRHVPVPSTPDSVKRPSVGQTMVLAACNRALRPRSKRGWASWAEGTSLAHLNPGLKTKSLTSQFFWEQMHRISLESLAFIERDLTKLVVADLGISLDTLFYDTTNFFTYIDSTNTRCDLPQRGHSKQKRTDLRLFGLALLVSRDGQIPLCTQIYPGNRADATEFPPALTLIRQRLADLSLTLQDVTLVYDRGNLSQKNQQTIDAATVGYVSALVPAQHRDLIAIPLSEYKELQTGRLKGLRVHRTAKTVWGTERTVVLYLSETLRAGQRRGLDQALVRAQKALSAWKERLEKKRSGSRSSRTADRRIDRILSAQFLKQILTITYDGSKTGAHRLHWVINQDAYRHLCDDYFGKRILITNRETWSTEEIIAAYRGQSQVENTFKQVKDDEHFAIRPQFHWTDQKIHVHAFICLVALLLGRVIEQQARKLGRTQSLSRMMDELDTIRLAMILTPSGKRAGRPRCQWMLEQTETTTMALFTSLVPDSPPFVYTQALTPNP
jgi:transposase